MMSQSLLPSFQVPRPGLCVKQSKVHQMFIVLGGCANLEMLSKALGMPKNQLTGSIHELLEMGYLLECEHKELCPISGRKTKFWRVIRF